MAKQKIAVLDRLIHDGKEYAAGDSVELDEAAAESLVKLGVAEVVEGSQRKSKKDAEAEAAAAAGGAQ